MNDDVRFDHLLEDLLLDSAPARAPARLLPNIASTTRPARQRPRWLALIKEPPMRLSSGVAVGSPTVRLASVLALTLALVLTTAGAVAVGASILQAHVPAPFGLARNGSLIYSDGGDIWIADETGANGVPIIAGPETDTTPWYSHDGRRFAFSRIEPDGSATLMVASADGTGVMRLTADYLSADWSPDDTELAVKHKRDGEPVISIVETAGTGIARTLDLGSLGLPAWGPVWRPTSGAELIFLGLDASTSRLGIYGTRPDGTGLRPIGAPGPAYASWFRSFVDPRISPDGSTIGFTEWEPHGHHGDEMTPVGYLRDLTTGTDQREEAYLYPHFSPDGATIMGEAASEGALVIGPLDGSQPLRTVATGWPGSDWDWDFSPDGTKAHITVEEPRATWIIDLATGMKARTTQSIPDFPDWQRLPR